MSQFSPSPTHVNIDAKGPTSGRPLAVDDLPYSVVYRYWRNVVMNPGNDCWDWSGYKDRRGYGRIGFTPDAGDHRTEYIHRVGYAIHHGPIPAGMVVMHKCDNPSCSNPNHIRLGTQLDNMRDRDSKGRDRYSNGKGPAPRFGRDEAEKLAAEYLSGMSLMELGAKHGVHYTTIWKTLKRYDVTIRPKGRYPRAMRDQIQETSR